MPSLYQITKLRKLTKIPFPCECMMLKEWDFGSLKHSTLPFCNYVIAANSHQNTKNRAKMTAHFGKLSNAGQLISCVWLFLQPPQKKTYSNYNDCQIFGGIDITSLL